jgi:folate-binding protein YgfZ
MPQTTPTASTLPDRALIRLSGEDVRGFLDGLVTSSLDPLPAYAALLTPQGKVIADFLIWADGDDLLLDCDSAAAEPLTRKLAMYRLRRAITIQRDDRLAVHWSLDGEGARDPRLADLGRRWIAPPSEPADGWLEHRLGLGVCEGAAELGDLLWLECNAGELNGVSFTKGCFVGQENTARMNWRGKVNRRLFVVPSGVAPPARVRVDYPELGLAVAHLRVDEVPTQALRPAWMGADA